MTLTQITEADVEKIALGAAVLGTGGGGDPHIGTLIASRLIRERGPVAVKALDELTDEDFVVPVGMIGAPSVAVEKIMAEEELAAVLRLLETACGRKATAIMPIEIGGGNSLIPVACAALTGLPIVDADAMGRAFPEAQMVTFHLAGYGPGYTSMVDSQGNAVLSKPVDGAWSEQLARSLTIPMGGSATMADYAYGGEVVRECAIPGTLTRARDIGALLMEPAADGTDPATRLMQELDAYKLFEGKVVDIERVFDGGFTKGHAVLEGLGVDKGGLFELSFQNEMLLARRDGQLAAVTPDLISVLDSVTGRPITTETLKYGARVHVIGMACHGKWRTAKGLETAGPAYFGYPVDFVPIEELSREEASA
ncbi:DUF917 domain-containing protein [Paeniglutamicibacter sp. R2-26]|uniref:DUF917 domain-containing protein n=1 Tax=Paeniglutamicibacter sp. R2-26 TaxID=3144417 RepID=UPI003EE7AFC2